MRSNLLLLLSAFVFGEFPLRFWAVPYPQGLFSPGWLQLVGRFVCVISLLPFVFLLFSLFTGFFCLLCFFLFVD